MIAVQSQSAPPLLQSFNNQADHVTTLDYANSRVSGINVSFSGDHALATLSESEGLAVGVTDAEIFAHQKRLAEIEGVWVEPVGAVAIAAVKKLAQAGTLTTRTRMVCISSGAGYKDTSLAADEAATITALDPLSFDSAAIVASLAS